MYVSLLASGVKSKDAKESELKQVTVTDFEHKMSELNVSQNVTASDNHKMTADDKRQGIIESEVSGQKEAAAENFNEMGSRHKDGYEKKLHDFGQEETLQKMEEEWIDPGSLEQNELQNVPESEKGVPSQSSASIVDDDQTVRSSEEMVCVWEMSEHSIDDRDMSESCEVKAQESAEQGQGDDETVSKEQEDGDAAVSASGGVKPQLSDESHMPSRL